LKTLEAEGRPFGLRAVCCVLTVQVKAEGVVCKKIHPCPETGLGFMLSL
jgi:hypothetical protein